MAIPPAMRAAVQDNIDRSGQHIFAVFPDDTDPGFLYTIGNANHGLPELLVVGDFAPHSIVPVLNEIGRRMRDTGKPPAGDISLGGKFSIRARIASDEAKARFTIQAGQYLGHENYAVVQLLLPDPSGRYPGDASCDPRYDVPMA